MILPEEDAKRFYRLYHSLLFDINKKYKIFEGLKSPSDLFKSNINDLLKLKDKLYASPELIDDFIKGNPMNLSRVDLEIVSSWRYFVRGRFYVVRHLKNHTIFLDQGDPPKAYGVTGITTPLEEVLGTDLPIMVEATLLPYKNSIIIDGTFLSFNVLFGSNMRRSINDSYAQAKASFGIIASLPFSQELATPDDSEILRGYLKTEYSRDVHHEEIRELIRKNPDLMTVYSEEMGKVQARAYRKTLKAIGIVEGWFALIEGVIIAGGRTREEAERIAESMLPADKIKLVYIFQLKAK